MPHASRYILLTILSLACAVGPLSAQNNQATDWQPVDQTVSDLDLRAVSTRHVEQGIGAFGQTGSLYQRSATDTAGSGLGQPLSQRYQLRRPGYTAYLDKPGYLVIDQQGEMNLNVAPSADGHYLDLVPPNTVYELVYRPNAPVPYYDPLYDLDYGNPLTSTRIDGLFHDEVTGEGNELLLPPLPIAQRLPPHLIRERELRAAEARQAAEQAEDEPAEVQDDAGADTPER